MTHRAHGITKRGERPTLGRSPASSLSSVNSLSRLAHPAQQSRATMLLSFVPRKRTRVHFLLIVIHHTFPPDCAKSISY
jgi:hypothetical protein